MGDYDYVNLRNRRYWWESIWTQRAGPFGTRWSWGEVAMSNALVEQQGEDLRDLSTESTVDLAASQEPLDMDTIFATLKNNRRRIALRYLRNHGGRTILSDLANHITAQENGIPESQITSKQRKRVYVSLYQIHLPGMDRSGVIAFNRARGTIEVTPRTAELYPYLDASTGVNSRANHYLTVTIFGGLLYGFGSLLLGPGSWFVSLTVVGLVASIVALSLLQTDDNLSPDDQSTRNLSPTKMSPGLLLARCPLWRAIRMKRD